MYDFFRYFLSFPSIRWQVNQHMNYLLFWYISDKKKEGNREVGCMNGSAFRLEQHCQTLQIAVFLRRIKCQLIRRNTAQLFLRKFYFEDINQYTIVIEIVCNKNSFDHQ